MQTPYALLLTALVGIVFFSLGWAVAWRMLSRQQPFPTTESPDTVADHLREWVGKQTKPFALSDAAHGIGLPLEKLTPAVVTRLGIELKKLGCKRCFDADHKGLYSPLGRDDQEAPTTKVPRQNVFIGTTNEADYAAPSIQLKPGETIEALHRICPRCGLNLVQETNHPEDDQANSEQIKDDTNSTRAVGMSGDFEIRANHVLKRMVYPLTEAEKERAERYEQAWFALDNGQQPPSSQQKNGQAGCH